MTVLSYYSSDNDAKKHRFVTFILSVKCIQMVWKRQKVKMCSDNIVSVNIRFNSIYESSIYQSSCD